MPNLLELSVIERSRKPDGVNLKMKTVTQARRMRQCSLKNRMRHSVLNGRLRSLTCAMVRFDRFDRSNNPNSFHAVVKFLTSHRFDVGTGCPRRHFVPTDTLSPTFLATTHIQLPRWTFSCRLFAAFSQFRRQHRPINTGTMIRRV